MIGLKKKQAFTLKNALVTDVGLRLNRTAGDAEWHSRIEGLRILGVQRAITVTDPLTLSLKKRATAYGLPDIPLVNGFSIEVLPSYGLNAALETYVQQKPLIAYRDKYVMLTLHEKAAVRELKGPVFELRARGYEPIILHRDHQNFAKLKGPALEYLSDLGCLLQLDLMTLAGVYGPLAKAKAETLLTKGLIHVVTTGVNSVTDAAQLTTLVIPANVIAALEQALGRHEQLLNDLHSAF